jgi:glycopeptide antibiotics resistance protein
LVDVAVQNLLGNAAMFVPVGFVVAWALRVHAGLVLIGIAAVAILIEVGQANLGVGRSSDITDAIMNTVGGALGIAAFGWLSGRLAATRPVSPRKDTQ